MTGLGFGPQFYAVGVPNIITLTDVFNYNSSANDTTHNFTACDYGAEAEDRYIVAAFTRGGLASHTVVSATLNGVTANVVATQGANLSGNGIVFAKVPTGTTGLTSSVTWSGAAAGTSVTIFRLVGGGTITFDDSAMTTTNGATIQADVKQGGVAIWSQGHRTGPSTTIVGFNAMVIDAITNAPGLHSSGYYGSPYDLNFVDQINRSFSWATGGDRYNAIVATFKPS